ncbi:MAG: SGNH/GDSL hydrolase family protein [Chloroflexota bacterium]|nr:SGNH/GDSL hydrolase family protein [Chloroflexota bacterium]
MAIILLIVFGVGALLLVGAVQKRVRWLRGLCRGLLVTYVTLVVLGAAVEGFFRFAYYDTFGRKSSENWLARYWTENTFGYRDREWIESDWHGKTTVAVVGDSFAAGWGVDDPADRFSDVLARRLGDDHYVFNLSVPGTTTPTQLDNLRASPIPPDVVILQYFLNDIDYAVMSLGLQIPLPEPPNALRDLYSVDFVYSLILSNMDVDYWQWEYSNYDNYVIWDIHRAQLEAFADYTNAIGARLIVVIFPNLRDPLGSIPYVDRVAQAFEARGVETLKLFDQVAALTPDAVVVSARDAHPNALFHGVVADLLYAQFFAGD